MPPDRRSPLLLAVAVLVLLGVAAALVLGGRAGNDAAAPPATSAPTTREGTRAGERTVEVLAVVDGDTLRVRPPGGGSERVRLIGIDTPEIAHDGRPAACWGDNARARLRDLVEGRRLRLRTGVEPLDRFGRTLATAAPVDGPAAGRDLSEIMALEGLARPLAIAPNTANAARIAALVREARREGRGLWTACPGRSAFPGRGS